MLWPLLALMAAAWLALILLLARGGRKGVTLVVLGSGGHTAEMVYLLQGLGAGLGTKHYAIARSDKHSVNRLQAVDPTAEKEGRVHYIYRAREVHQSMLTTVFTTLLAACESLCLLVRVRPRILFVNGPGTCFPLIILVRLLRIFCGLPGSTVFVETITRTSRLSMTVRLSSWAIDLLVVNWKQLAETTGAKFIPLYTS
ncbi:Beta-1,4-N-acetylglucosaminyltransferase [Giardia muris]|uniref:UDP-N-acetylglucosamine transferase subunit ALG14 n=1 Tax=Giardia muris TaxID=5742 RepID=A0A4Z1SS36_GIAMU|nr:Beta-1,4-N-acetylglucosaminyltransferase [Giardia muris]|eukprot:TNJ28694.1 Beta-1,4-N-acetylglucosaminyltransferase [Giardia muris]